MFGYVTCIKSQLTKKETDRYAGVYCGICHALRNRHGQLERFALNYDMTFAAIFISALYEPEEEIISYRCSAHPFQKKQRIESPLIDYAADMTILLAYYKCLDDWEDEGKRTGRLFANYLKKDYDRVGQCYPRQKTMVEESIRAITALEKSDKASIDDLTDAAGRLLREIYVYQEDFWAESMRQFGYALGRFIYLMDAAMDYGEDRRKGIFNPLFLIDSRPEDLEDILMMEIGEAARIYERLPILQDDSLIRNILYGGVFLKYKAKYQKKDKKAGKEK